MFRCWKGRKPTFSRQPIVSTARDHDPSGRASSSPTAEIVILVNVRVLSEHLGLPPVRVLAARARTSNFPSALERLMGGR